MSAMHNEGFLNTGDLEIADIIKLSLDPIFVHEMNARYLSFPDKFSETRKDFMKNVFQSYQSYDFYEGSTKFISSAEHHYQVLIIGGNDLPRISDILKKNSPILARKLKICLTKGVSASRRAHIPVSYTHLTLPTIYSV